MLFNEGGTDEAIASWTRERIDSAWSEIQNQYKRRYDLVPQLVETVKGAAEFEQETITAVTEARASVGRMSLPEGAPTDPEAAFYRGDYARAARAWEARAETTDPARAGSLWISAADAWALAERPDAARDALRRLDRTTLLASDRSRLELVLADIALQEGREDEADVLLLNTCSIREKAQEKVFSQLGQWRELKQQRPEMIIGVGGCVANTLKSAVTLSLRVA